MAMAKTATRGIELEPIDRLEEKLKRLVSMVERMQGEQVRDSGAEGPAGRGRSWSSAIPRRGFGRWSSM